MDKDKVPIYWRGNSSDIVNWFGRYIVDCTYLHNLAIHTLARKGKLDAHLTQMEEGAKTLASYVTKIREAYERLNSNAD